MTLLYDWNGYRYTLEQLVDYNDETKKLWDNLLPKEHKFWVQHGVISLDEVIIETSDAFEEELILLGYNIEFIKPNDESFNFNLLLDGLRINTLKENGIIS